MLLAETEIKLRFKLFCLKWTKKFST